MTIPNLSIGFGVLITLLFVFIGILFDIIGVAVTSADEGVFHSMNARQVRGSKLAVKFKKNADKVASFCNDVIGDICGIVSGGLGTVLTLNLCNYLDLPSTITSIVITSVISSITVGGKAYFKNVAARNCDKITFIVGKILNFFK